MPRKFTMFRLFFRIFVLFFVLRSIQTTDEYVKEQHKKCQKTKRPYFCVTFRIAKFIHELDYEGPENGAVKLVKISHDRKITEQFPTPRFINSDSESDKIVKFLQRKIIDFFTTHGIAFEVPEGVRMVQQGRDLQNIDDDNTINDKTMERVETIGRGMKEKKVFILSILIVAKLIKIMFLVNIIFFVLLFIKKIILVSAIVFPSVLSHIKQACQLHHQKAAIISEEAPAYPSSSWFGWRQDNPEKRYWDQ